MAGENGVRIFALDGSGLIHRSVERPDWGRTAQVSADGRLLSWSSADHPPAFHRLDQPGLEPVTPPIENVFGGLDHYGGPFVLEPQGNLGVLHFLDPETLQPTGRRLESGTFTNGDVSPDGRWLAVGRGSPQAGGVTIYDRQDLRATTQLEPEGGAVLYTTSAAWHPDGRRVAAVFTRSNDTSSFAVVFDREAGRAISPEIRNPTATTEAVFTPNGQFLLTGDFSGKVVVRDAETYQPTGQEFIVGTYGLGGEGGRPLQFTDDGRYLISTLGAPLLVDVATWSPIGDPFPSDSRSLLGVPDGARYLPTVTDNNIVVWALEPDGWADIACQAAGRNLTPTEWEQYGPTDTERVATCPQWN